MPVRLADAADGDAVSTRVSNQRDRLRRATARASRFSVDELLGVRPAGRADVRRLRARRRTASCGTRRPSSTSAQNAATSPSYGMPTEPALTPALPRRELHVRVAARRRGARRRRRARRRSARRTTSSTTSVVSSAASRGSRGRRRARASPATRAPTRSTSALELLAAASRPDRARSCRGRSCASTERTSSSVSRGSGPQMTSPPKTIASTPRATSASTASSACGIPWTS